MKTIITADSERIEGVFALLCQTLREKPDAVIALSAADDCLPIYEKLAQAALQGDVNLSHARFFAVAEFEGLSAEDPRACRSRLLNALPGVSGMVFLTSDNLESYDTQIAAAGGLDLVILGLGINARIGFNEPATPFDSRSHRQKLTPATRRELAALFGSEEHVPEHGLTMGIKTLVEAKKIVVTASGEGRAKAVFDMLYGRDDSAVPAAFLQLPPEVLVFLDKAAAIKL